MTSIDTASRALLICRTIAESAAVAYGYALRLLRPQMDDDEDYGWAALICIEQIRRMADILEGIVKECDAKEDTDDRTD